MTERISSTSRYNMLVEDMKTNMYNYNKLTAQLASGKKVNDLTDDPIVSVNVLNTNRQLGQLETFETNVGMASAELSALDDLFSLATGYLNNAWNRAVQANNQTYSGESLEALKSEIDEIIKTMVDLANTEYNDNYIFSGANTKTLTYDIDEKGNLIYNGTPQGDPNYIRQTEVSDGVFEVINTTGDKIFGWYNATQEQNADGDFIYHDKEGKNVIEKIDDATGAITYTYEDGTNYDGSKDDLRMSIIDEDASGALGALKKLSNSIQKVLDGDVENGYDEMNKTLDMFGQAHTTITTEQTKFGGVANRLEMTTSTLETNSTNLTTYLTEINEVDYAEAITNWMNAQYAYQASLQVTSASMNLSLLNYIQ